MNKEEMSQYLDALFQKNGIDKTKFDQDVLQMNTAVVQAKCESIQQKLSEIEAYEPVFSHIQKGGVPHE